MKWFISIFFFQDGWSALMWASQEGHTDIAKYLIEAKASVDLQRQVYYVKIKIIQCSFPVTDWVLRCLHHATAILILSNISLKQKFHLIYKRDRFFKVLMIVNGCILQTFLSLRLCLFPPFSMDGVFMFASFNGHTGIVKCLLESKVAPFLQEEWYFASGFDDS